VTEIKHHGGPSATLSKSFRFLGIAVLGLLALTTFGVLQRRQGTSVPSGSTYAKEVPETAETLRIARELEDFHDKNRERVLAQVVKSARKDPQYLEGLLQLTEASVMSMQGFSEAQKKQIWKRVKDSQEAVRNMPENP